MIKPIALVILSVLSCPNVRIINKTNEWNEQDKKALSVAVTRCREIYSDAPCLVMFRKAERGIYSALCGVKKKDK